MVFRLSLTTPKEDRYRSDASDQPTIVEPAEQVGSETWDDSPPPDAGAEAWLALLSSWCMLFCTFGLINSIGTFQGYYEVVLLKDYSASAVAWIPSLQIFFSYLTNPFTGRLYDIYGPRYLVLVGSFLQVFGLMMLSLSTKYYQVLLAVYLVGHVGTLCTSHSFDSNLVRQEARRGLRHRHKRLESGRSHLPNHDQPTNPPCRLSLGYAVCSIVVAGTTHHSQHLRQVSTATKPEASISTDNLRPIPRHQTDARQHRLPGPNLRTVHPHQLPRRRGLIARHEVRAGALPNRHTQRRQPIWTHLRGNPRRHSRCL